jgi:hypothetical protein
MTGSTSLDIHSRFELHKTPADRVGNKIKIAREFQIVDDHSLDRGCPSTQ